jgi:hypothetical protein
MVIVMVIIELLVILCSLAPLSIPLLILPLLVPLQWKLKVIKWQFVILLFLKASKVWLYFEHISKH